MLLQNGVSAIILWNFISTHAYSQPGLGREKTPETWRLRGWDEEGEGEKQRTWSLQSY